MPDIDTLSIEITANSSGATRSLNSLTKAVEKLKSATSGGFGNLTRLKNNLAGLTAALAPLGQMGDFSKNISAITRLPKAIESMSGANLEKFTANLNKFVEALDPLLSRVKESEAGLTALAQVMKVKYPEGTTKATKGSISLAAQIGTLYIKFRTLYFIGQKVAQVFTKMTSESMKYQETLNLYRIAMGSYYEEGLAYAKKVQNSLGIDAAEWLKYQAVFMNMAKGFGIVTENAEIMSRNLTQIGYDLASVFNVDFETAMQKLESGISGQPRPMREWGFDMSEATLKMVALNKGIKKNVENMTQAEKAQLRYIQIYETVQKLGIEGDLARTLQTPANAMRVFQANVTLAARAIGNVMIPVLNQLLPRMTAMARAVANIANKLSSFTGFKITEIDYSGLENAVTGVDEELTDATEQAEKLKSAIMGFDELNVISPNDNGSGTGNDLGDILNFELPDNINWLKEGLSQNIDDLTERMELLVIAIEKVVGAFALIWGGSKIIDALDKIKTSFANVSSSVTTLSKGIAGTAGVVASMATAIKAGKEFADVLDGDGDGSIAAACSSLVGSVALGAAGGAMYGGWLGALIGALASLVTTALSAEVELQKTAVATSQAKAWVVGTGEAFSVLRSKVQEFLQSLNWKKLEEWNDKVKDANKDLKDAKNRYNDLVFVLDQKDVWSTEDIDDLTAAFNSLVTALKNLNNVKISSLLSNLNDAITRNITPELTGRFKELAGQIAALQTAINIKIDDLSGTYSDIVSRIRENGGIITKKDRDDLQKIVDDLSSFSLEGDVSKENFLVGQETARENSYVIGTNQEEVKENISNLLGDLSAYEDALRETYVTNRATLKRLAEIDESDFNGAFGISKNLTGLLRGLESDYNSQINEARDQVRGILGDILTNYTDKMNRLANDLYEEQLAELNDPSPTNWRLGLLQDLVLFFEQKGEWDAFKNEQGAVEEWISNMINSIGANLTVNVTVDGQEVASIVESNNNNSGVRTTGNGLYVYNNTR